MRWHDEDGMLTPWMLGLCVALLLLAGVTVDLWRVMAERRALVGVAESAAVAAASGLDEAAFRAAADSGDLGRALQLAAPRARALAARAVAAQDGVYALTDWDLRLGSDGATVMVAGEVPFTLLHLLPDGAVGDQFRLRVTATAEPRLGE